MAAEERYLVVAHRVVAAQVDMYGPFESLPLAEQCMVAVANVGHRWIVQGAQLVESYTRIQIEVVGPDWTY